jgi:mevalonate kinase
MITHASAQAHGKIILIGEHSVVYQHGALVAPFRQANIVVEIMAQKGDITIDSDYHHGLFFSEGAPIEGLQVLVTAFLEKYQLPKKDLHFVITSNMLSRRGLGSSAAVAKAMTEALFKFFMIDYDREDIVEFIKMSELIYHTRPSGIDMHAVLSEDLLWYQAGTATRIKPAFPLFIVVADTGTASQTKLSVSAVAQRVQAGEIEVISAIDYLGELAKLALAELEGGDLYTFALYIKEAQNQLEKIGVSSPELEQLIAFSYEHDALAAKLTGGGQGGCMFALFDEFNKCEKFVNMLEDRGVKHSWIMKIE